MMRQMREHTKWVMILIVISFVGLMVFEWGMDMSGRSTAQASGGVIGEVDGTPVSYEAFLTEYRQLYQQQQNNQAESITERQNRQIEDAAWEQLVNDMLVQKEIRRRGITVSDNEVRQAARFAPPPEFYGNPLFQTNGQFDINKYHQFLSSPAVDRQLLAQMEAYYRDMIPRSKLAQQVTSGIYLPDSELWRLWRERTETARVRFVAIDPGALIPDNLVTVTAPEIRAYYDSHQDELEHPARATVRYALLERKASAADTAFARERAESIRQEIIDGEEFAVVAQRESSDRASADQGGSLGTFSRGQFVPAFDSVAFSLPLQEISEPVLTQFGFHIIQITERSGEQSTGRHILIPIEDGAAMEETLIDRADSLEALGDRSGLETAARTMGLTIESADVTEDDPFLPGVGPADEAADFMFRDGEPGETSEVYEGATGFYLVQLESRIPAGVWTLEEATPAIRLKLAEEKKLERARMVAREIVDGVRGGQTLELAASAQRIRSQEAGPFTRTEFVPGLGRANAAVGAGFGLQAGQTSGVIEADGKLYVIQLLEKTEADRAEFDAQKEMIRGQTVQALQQERWNDFLLALRENAKIVDNRDEVLRAPEDTTGLR